MGRRRRWSDAEKLWIVEASMAGRRMVSATARQHGISRSLLTTWRKLHREGQLGADAAPSFAAVIVAPEPGSAAVMSRPGPSAYSGASDQAFRRHPITDSGTSDHRARRR